MTREEAITKALEIVKEFPRIAERIITDWNDNCDSETDQIFGCLVWNDDDTEPIGYQIEDEPIYFDENTSWIRSFDDM